MITRDSEAVIDNVTVSDLLSDHALILVHVKHPKPLSTQIMTIIRKLRGLDATSLAAEVSTLASKTFHTDASLDSIAKKYNSILAAELDKFAPCRTKTVTRRPSQVLPLYSSQDTLANQFADFFEDKVQKIRDSLPVVEAHVVSLPPCNSELCVFMPVTISDVSRIVMKSSTKACALDPMPTWLLKELLLSIAPLMTDFINSSLQSGIIPDSMNSAAVTPLLNKLSLNINILKNYRPVSNLRFVS